jgi:hypothetical protein
VNDGQCADAGIAGTDASAPHCNTTTNACVECLATADCSGTVPFCDTQTPPAGPAGRADRCQECLPAAVAGDGGMLGCDGGPGSTCQAALGTAGAGAFVCR